LRVERPERAGAELPALALLVCRTVARLANNQKDGQTYDQRESDPAQDQQALFFTAVIDHEVIPFFADALPHMASGA
jgi:hypothetical protein